MIKDKNKRIYINNIKRRSLILINSYMRKNDIDEAI